MTEGPVAGESAEAGSFQGGLEAATSSQLCLIVTEQMIFESRTLSNRTVGCLGPSQELGVLIRDKACPENS